MSLLNFFRRAEEQRLNENTLNITYKQAKKKIDEFIKLTKPATDKRRQMFDNLFSFVLDGNQWTNAEEKDLDGDMPLTFNFSENYIDRYMARLFPRNSHTGVLEVGVKIYNETTEVREKYEKSILAIYKKEKIVSTLMEQGVNYLCGGAAVFYYPRDPITKTAQLFSLDPRDCYFGWRGNRLVQFAYREYVGDNKFNLYYWDLAEFLFFDAKKDAMTKKENTFDFIPVSWIPNNPKPHKHEGRPKTLSLYNLDRAYNFKATNFSQRVDDNTNPHLVLFSDTVAIDQITRGRRKKTKLSKDDDAKYLKVDEGKEIESFLNLLEGKIKTKAGLVDSSGAIKSAVSGLSLSFQYSDMMDLIGFMRIAWDEAFRELNTAILAYEYGDGKEIKTDPVYHPFISLDNKQRTEEYVLMIKNKIISHRDAIDELRGVESPDEKWQDILSELKEIEPDDEGSEKKEKVV